MLVLQRVMLERVPWDSVASLVLGRVSVLVVCHVAGLWPSGSVALTGDGDCGASLSGEGSARHHRRVWQRSEWIHLPSRRARSCLCIGFASGALLRGKTSARPVSACNRRTPVCSHRGSVPWWGVGRLYSFICRHPRCGSWLRMYSSRLRMSPVRRPSALRVPSAIPARWHPWLWVTQSQG